MDSSFSTDKSCGPKLTDRQKKERQSTKSSQRKPKTNRQRIEQRNSESERKLNIISWMDIQTRFRKTERESNWQWGDQWVDFIVSGQSWTKSDWLIEIVKNSNEMKHKKRTMRPIRYFSIWFLVWLLDPGLLETNPNSLRAQVSQLRLRMNRLPTKWDRTNKMSFAFDFLDDSFDHGLFDLNWTRKATKQKL